MKKTIFLLAASLGAALLFTFSNQKESVTTDLYVEDVFFSLTCPSDQTLYFDDNCPIVLPDYRDSVELGFNESSLDSLKQTPAPGGVIDTDNTDNIEVMVVSYRNFGRLLDTCMFNVMVVDTTRPVLTCPKDTVLFTDAACFIQLPNFTNRVRIENDCGFVQNRNINQFPSPGQASIEGDSLGLTVTMTGNDGNGNTGVCEFAISVRDTLGPVFDCPRDIRIDLDTVCNFTLPSFIDSIALSDNCVPKPSLEITQTPPPGLALEGDGDRVEVTLSGDDNNGNISKCIFQVILDDNIDPVIDCPDNIVVSPDPDCKFTLPSFIGQVTATDNCSPLDSITYRQSPEPGERIDASGGFRTISITADDSNGNTSQCFFDAIFQDSSPPDVSCPEETVVIVDGNCATPFPDLLPDVQFSDNCTVSDSLRFLQIPNQGSALSKSTAPDSIRIEVRDLKNNVGTCLIKLTLRDTTPPAINCPESTRLTVDANCSLRIPDFRVNLVDSTLCENRDVFLRQVPAVGTVLTEAYDSLEIDVIVSDTTGNETKCVFFIEVADVTKPVLTCPDDELIFVGDACEYIVPDLLSQTTVSDNCSDLQQQDLLQEPAAGTMLTGRDTVYRVTMRAVDESGNEGSCVQRIFMRDNKGPALDCPETKTLTPEADGSFIIPSLIEEAVIQDNCSPADLIETQQLPLAGTAIAVSDFPVDVTISASDEGDFEGNCTVTLQFEQVGLAKAVEFIEINERLSYDISLIFTIENLGTTPLYDLQILDTLSMLGSYLSSGEIMEDNYRPLGPPEIIQNTATPFNTNILFNGESRPGLLEIGQGVLNPGEQLAIRLQIRAFPESAPTTLFNSAYLWADRNTNGRADGQIKDTSTDGRVADPDRNGIADEGVPTPLEFPSNGMQARVGGVVLTESGTPLEGVEIRLEGDTSLAAVTADDGSYSFIRLREDSTYTVTPVLDENHINGVSTFDIYLIEQHLLAIKVLNSPYKIMAADVNSSGSVTYFDLLQMRKLILSIDRRFANSNSWRFIDADFVFDDPQQPFLLGQLSETIVLNNLPGRADSVNFVAMKVGDVNSTVRLDGVRTSLPRSSNAQTLEISDQSFVAGQQLTVPVRMSDISSVLSVQFGLQIDPAVLEIAGVQPGLCNDTHLNYDSQSGELVLSWTSTGLSAEALKTDDPVLFYLNLNAKREGTLTGKMRLSDRYLSTELINGAREWQPLLLQIASADELSDAVTIGMLRPNPVRENAFLDIRLPESQRAEWTVWDKTGRQLLKGSQQLDAGLSTLVIPLREIQAEGVYQLQVKVGEKQVTRSLLIINR